MGFQVSKNGGVTLVEVEGQLIVGNRQELKQKVLEHLEAGDRKFVIDFANTGYIDSSGLGVLVSLSKKIREQGGELRLSSLNPGPTDIDLYLLADHRMEAPGFRTAFAGDVASPTPEARYRELSKFLAPNAYVAYIIHAQVITATALVLRNVDLYPLLKFGLVALIGVSLSFVLGNLIRKLPYTNHVL